MAEKSVTNKMINIEHKFKLYLLNNRANIITKTFLSIAAAVDFALFITFSAFKEN